MKAVNRIVLLLMVLSFSLLIIPNEVEAANWVRPSIEQLSRHHHHDRERRHKDFWEQQRARDQGYRDGYKDGYWGYRSHYRHWRTSAARRAYRVAYSYGYRQGRAARHRYYRNYRYYY